MVIENENLCMGKCCHSTFTLTKPTMQTQISHHVRTSVDQCGKQLVNTDVKTLGKISNVRKSLRNRNF